MSRRSLSLVISTYSLSPFRFRTEHLSDMLRLVSLYRYGGIYIDSDVVVLRNIGALPLNYVGAENSKLLGNAVIGVQHGGVGRQIIQIFLDELRANFSDHEYLYNGPYLVTRIVAKMCGTKIFKTMTCGNLHIFDSNAFYPIPSTQWRKIFNPKYLHEILRKSRNAYLLHIWNWLSKRHLIKTKSKAAYTVLAKKHCPKTFTAATRYF